MLNGRFNQIAIIFFFAGLLSQTACTFENDEEYEVAVRASYFKVLDQQGNPHLHQYINGTFITDWTSRFNSGGSFGDFSARGNSLWFSEPGNGKIVEADLTDESILRQAEGLSVRPDLISLGETYLLIADSTNEKLGFWHLRKEDFQEVPVSGKPGGVVYNNRKFYLLLDTSKVALYNELALSPIAEFDLGFRITELQFDKFFNLRATGEQSGEPYFAIIDANGNYVSREAAPFGFTKVRYSPYLSQRFETEFLDQVGIRDLLISPTLPGVDSASNLEVDFFSGLLFYTYRDTFYQYNLNTFQSATPEPFSFQMVKSFHHLTDRD